MSEERWDCTETFVMVCKVFTALHEANIEMGHPNRVIMTLDDVNALQDLLKENGFAIQKINNGKETNT